MTTPTLQAARTRPGPARTTPARRRPARIGPARLGALALLTAVLLIAGAGTAAAHVTVNPPSAVAGSYATITFKVPTESATASTVSVQVTLPREHPLPSVSVAQVPGWTATIATSKLDPPVTEGTFTLTEAVTSVTWRADDGIGIKPGFFGQFSLSVGPLPDVAALRFPATQTYSDASVVRWDQVPPAPGTPGGDEPDHPAPSLTVTPAGAAASPAGAADAPSGPDTTARVLGMVALILAAAALLVAALGLRRRRPAGPAVPPTVPPTVPTAESPTAPTAVSPTAPSEDRS